MKRLCRFILVFGLAALAGCETLPDQSQAIATLPYHRKSNGRVVIPIMINETGPHSFALDTGASISAVLAHLHDVLEPRLPTTRHIRVQGLVGAGTYPAVRIDEVGVGATVWRDVEAVVLPEAVVTRRAIDGLLGLDFMRDYVVSFPVRERVVNLFRPDQFDASAYKGWLAIPMKYRRVSHTGAHLYFLDLYMGVTRIPAVLDLGVDFNILNMAAAKALGVTRQQLRRHSIEDVSGAIGTAADLFGVNISHLSAGTMRWRDEEFVVGDLPVFEMLTDPRQPAAILGAGLFLQRNFVIDFPHSRLLLQRHY